MSSPSLPNRLSYIAPANTRFVTRLGKRLIHTDKIAIYINTLHRNSRYFAVIFTPREHHPF